MAERFGSTRNRMAIRIASTALLCWLCAFVWMTWGQIRVLHAQRDAESAAVKYASAVVHERIAEMRRLNRELDFHIQVLRNSYPRILKADQASQPSNSSFSRRQHAAEKAETALHSAQTLQPVADLSQPTPLPLLSQPSLLRRPSHPHPRVRQDRATPPPFRAAPQ